MVVSVDLGLERPGFNLHLAVKFTGCLSWINHMEKGRTVYYTLHYLQGRQNKNVIDFCDANDIFLGNQNIK